MEAVAFEPIPIPRGTRVCCKTVWAPIDYAFFFFEVISAIGAIVTGAKKDYAGCGVSIGAFICFGVGHSLVRKYGNVAIIVRRFNTAQQHYSQTVGQQKDQIQILTSDVDRLIQTSRTLTEERDKLRFDNEHFASQLEGMAKALDELKEGNQRLADANNQLTDKVADLEKLTTSLQERIVDFSKQNAAFILEIKQIASAIPVLSQSARSLAESRADIGDNVSAFENELRSTQGLIRLIIEGLRKSQMDLSTQLSGLENERGRLVEEVQRLREEREKFQAASAAADLTISRLTETQTRLEHRIAAFSQSAHDVSDQTRLLQEVVADLHHTDASAAQASDALQEAQAHLEDEETADREQDKELARQINDATQ